MDDHYTVRVSRTMADQLAADDSEPVNARQGMSVAPPAPSPTPRVGLPEITRPQAIKPSPMQRETRRVGLRQALANLRRSME